VIERECPIVLISDRSTECFRRAIQGNVTDRLRETERCMNLCVADKSPAALARMLPHSVNE
jgi:hypothetical protein